MLGRLFNKAKPYIAPVIKPYIPKIEEKIKPFKPLVEKVVPDKYMEKWRKLKSEITGSDNHGLKEILIQMKSNPKYKKWDARKKYTMLKYAKMAAKE